MKKIIQTFRNKNMGIESLNRWISNLAYPGIRLKQLPENILSLMLDFNGVIHFARNYAYAMDEDVFDNKYQYKQRLQLIQSGHFDAKTLERDLVTKMLEKLDEIVDNVAPSQTLVIAVDGVAPPAKLKQQRERRFAAGFNKPIDPKVQNTGPTSITPGTNLMKTIDKHINSWIASKRHVLPPYVIYSSHMEHGEGEHKIMNMIRDGIVKPGDGYHSIYGKDGDLNMLTFLSKYRDSFLIIREDYTDIISTGHFAHGIYNDMNGLYDNPPANYGVPKDMAIQDFIALSFFVGNDFLPRMFGWKDIDVAITTMIKTYKEVIQIEHTTLVGPDKKLNWKVLALFLEKLAENEPKSLEYKASFAYDYPSEILEQSCVERELIVDLDAHYRKRYDEPAYKMKSFDFTKFRTHWYWSFFNSRSQDGNDIEDIIKTEKITNDDIESVNNWFLYGMEWIIMYYNGDITADFFKRKPEVTATLPDVMPEYMYPYRKAPLFTDLAKTCRKLADLPERKHPLEFAREFKPFYIGPHHQLISVMPQSSVGLIPKELRHLIMSGGNLSDIAPINYTLENECKNNDYHVVPLISNIPLHRIILEVDKSLKWKKYGNDEYPIIPFHEVPTFISYNPNSLPSKRTYQPRKEYTDNRDGHGKGKGKGKGGRGKGAEDRGGRGKGGRGKGREDRGGRGKGGRGKGPGRGGSEELTKSSTRGGRGRGGSEELIKSSTSGRGRGGSEELTKSFRKSVEVKSKVIVLPKTNSIKKAFFNAPHNTIHDITSMSLITPTIPKLTAKISPIVFGL
jgi:hypothetical protein